MNAHFLVMNLEKTVHPLMCEQKMVCLSLGLTAAADEVHNLDSITLI